MQLSASPGRSTLTQGIDHFYTTDPIDFTASGYRFEGITGYLYPDKFANTIALHHWYHSIVSDNFYTHEEPKGSPSGGYQGIIGYIYRNPAAGTAPLLRWYHETRHDHFYATDPKADKY
ncbi:hypothetical protein BGZ82_004462 [Podila clonocystis]|nr:hypothetical protein BGZ82_004462 [Podila clonocystis]